MNKFIENQLNQPMIVSDWRDEDGCNKRGEGMLHNNLKSAEESEFLNIIIQRLVNIGSRPQILRNKVPLGGKVNIFDSQNQKAIFKPIAVLFHLGDFIGQETYGHYKTDILDLHGSWFRTSDDDIPWKFSERNVSDQGYIYLYKKIQ